jgi:hypothetical protein
VSVDRIGLRGDGAGAEPFVIELEHTDDGRLDDGAPNGSSFRFVLDGDQPAVVGDYQAVVTVDAGATADVRALFYIDLLALPSEQLDYQASLSLDNGDAWSVSNAVSFDVQAP